jgi:hypothetical protein
MRLYRNLLHLCVCALLGITSQCYAQDQVEKRLEELSNVHGPSGFENSVRDILGRVLT